MSTTHFIIYSRSYCHLCEDMRLALDVLRRDYHFSVEVIDIDQDEMLLQRYDELVPVLQGWHAGQLPRQLCHYFLDEMEVRRFLLGNGL